MEMKKRAIKLSLKVLVGTMMTLMMMSGCSNLKVGEPTLGITIYRYDDKFISNFKDEILLYAQDKISLNMNDSGNNQTIQNDQIDALISKKVSVLAINLVDVAAANEVVEKAKKKDVPLIFFNREPDKAIIDSYDQCWYVGTDSSQAGKLQGEMIIDAWEANPQWDKNGDGRIQYVLLEGEEGHRDTVLRSRYVIETLEDAGIKSELLAKDYGNWDSIEAKDLMDQWLKDYGNAIELVISNNDAMAIGAIVSIQKKGYTTTERYMPIIGVDGLPEFLAKIQSGLAIGTVINDAKSQSEIIVDLSMAIINKDASMVNLDNEGNEVKILRVPYIAVTSDNVDKYLE